jgi:hypothetical protein
MRAIRRSLLVLALSLSVFAVTASPVSADESGGGIPPELVPVIELVFGPGSCC